MQRGPQTEPTLPTAGSRPAQTPPDAPARRCPGQPLLNTSAPAVVWPPFTEINPFRNEGDLIQGLSDSAKIYPPCRQYRAGALISQTMRCRSALGAGRSHDAGD